MAAPSHAWHNGIAARLPVYSDRIAQDFHLIPFYPCGWCFRLALKTQLFNCRISSSPPRGICGGQATKNRTDWDLRPIMSCSNISPIFEGSYHSLVRRIRYTLAGRSSDSASTPQTPSRFSPVAFICSSTSQQRSCRRFALRSLFTCTLRTSTCKLPIFCFRGYYSTPFADLQYKIDILMVLPRQILYQILPREPNQEAVSLKETASFLSF